MTNISKEDQKSWEQLLINDQHTQLNAWRMWFVNIQEEFDMAMHKLQLVTISEDKCTSEGFLEAIENAKWAHMKLSAALIAYNAFCDYNINYFF